MYNQCEGCSRRQTFPCTVFSMGATTVYARSSLSLPWSGMKENVYTREVRVCCGVINRIQVTAAAIVPWQLFFVRGSVWRQCEACVQKEGGHLRTAVVIMYSTFSPLVPTTRTGSTQKGVLWSNDWKTLQRAVFDYFHCKQGNQLTCYV
jgi:hypothetical protein